MKSPFYTEVTIYEDEDYKIIQESFTYNSTLFFSIVLAITLIGSMIYVAYVNIEIYERTDYFLYTDWDWKHRLRHTFYLGDGREPTSAISARDNINHLLPGTQ